MLRYRLSASNSNRILTSEGTFWPNPKQNCLLTVQLSLSVWYVLKSQNAKAEALQEYLVLPPHFKDGETEAQKVPLARNWTYAGRH